VKYDWIYTVTFVQWHRDNTVTDWSRIPKFKGQRHTARKYLYRVTALCWHSLDGATKCWWPRTFILARLWHYLFNVFIKHAMDGRGHTGLRLHVHFLRWISCMFFYFTFALLFASLIKLGYTVHPQPLKCEKSSTKCTVKSDLAVCLLSAIRRCSWPETQRGPVRRRQQREWVNQRLTSRAVSNRQVEQLTVLLAQSAALSGCMTYCTLAVVCTACQSQQQDTLLKAIHRGASCKHQAWYPQQSSSTSPL